MNILIISPSQQMREGYQRLFEGDEHCVRVAEDVSATPHDNWADLLVTNLSIPEEVGKQLVKEHLADDIPVLFLMSSKVELSMLRFARKELRKRPAPQRQLVDSEVPERRSRRLLASFMVILESGLLRHSGRTVNISREGVLAMVPRENELSVGTSLFARFDLKGHEVVLPAKVVSNRRQGASQYVGLEFKECSELWTSLYDALARKRPPT